MSVSGKLKAPVKAALPTAARGPSGKHKVSFKNGGGQVDDLDQEIMEINSNRSSAKVSAQVPPMRLSHDQADTLYETKSPSVYDGIISGAKSAQQESKSFRYQVPRSARVERKKDPEIDLEKPLIQLGSPKPSKSNLANPAKYKPDSAPQETIKNNFFKKPAAEKLEVSGVDSTPNATERQKKSENLNQDSLKDKIKNKNSYYPGQNYADERLKKLRAEFLRKDMPIIDDNEFLRQKPTKGEEVLEQNLANLLEQHDNDRGGGDHGPCYVPGQLLEKFPFSKKGTLKKDHHPLDYNEAKPIFGDANVPREAFNPKGLPLDHTTTYRVASIYEVEYVPKKKGAEPEMRDVVSCYDKDCGHIRPPKPNDSQYAVTLKLPE